VLEIDQVSKCYGEVVAVRELSLAVRPGQILGLVGPAGAGATTALRIAAGVLVPDSGRVSWGTGPLTRAARRRLGYLPQRRGLPRGTTVLDHLVLLAELHGLDTNTAHRDALLWIERLGLRAVRGRRISALDPSTAHRVHLAGVLIHGPEALLLDDPFTGLDEAGIHTWGTVLRGLAGSGTAVLLTARDVGLAEQVCDRIGFLHNGQLTSVGSPAELHGDVDRLAIVDAAELDWVTALPHCRLRARTGTRAVLELDAEADEQAILAAALDSGPIAEFTLRAATLADLYPEPADDDRRALSCAVDGL
jgi:ABC-2 type transport system ATP-binding protein